MIEVVRFDDKERYPGMLESMFRLRHEIFVERLGWKIQTFNGLEQDQFDRPGTIYLIRRNAAGEVVACTRMLQTDRPNLLRDVFPELVDGDLPSSPTIWEASRLAVDHRKERLASLPQNWNLCGELFCGIQEFAISVGAVNIVSVSDVRLERILKIGGWEPKRLGKPHFISGIDVCGEIFEVGPAALARIQGRAKIKEPVLSMPADLPLRKVA
jgi:acyl homoserine lactone synthase